MSQLFVREPLQLIKPCHAPSISANSASDGSDFMGERLVVQFARGSNRPRDFAHPEQRAPPRPRRTVHRMTITGLPFETSWQVS